MEKEEISCETKAKFRLNLKDLDKHYDGDGTLMKILAFKEYFSAVGVLACSKRNKAIFHVRSFGVKKSNCEVDLEVFFTDTRKIKIVDSYTAIPFGDEPGLLHSKFYIPSCKESRIQTITGIVTLTFEQDDSFALKDELIERFGIFLLETESEKPADIKIECQEEKIEFHKSLLSKSSDVFQNMVENPNFIESHNGVITMKDVSPDTIKTFKKLLYENQIEKTDLDVKLLIFCDRYNIKPMVGLCSQHLKKSITKDNLMEIVDAAYKINDDDLLKKAMHFVKLNYVSVEDIEQWEDFIQSNPECVAKMMKFLMFK